MLISIASQIELIRNAPVRLYTGSGLNRPFLGGEKAPIDPGGARFPHVQAASKSVTDTQPEQLATEILAACQLLYGTRWF